MAVDFVTSNFFESVVHFEYCVRSVAFEGDEGGDDVWGDFAGGVVDQDGVFGGGPGHFWGEI